MSGFTDLGRLPTQPISSSWCMNEALVQLVSACQCCLSIIAWSLSLLLSLISLSITGRELRKKSLSVLPSLKVLKVKVLPHQLKLPCTPPLLNWVQLQPASCWTTWAPTNIPKLKQKLEAGAFIASEVLSDYSFISVLRGEEGTPWMRQAEAKA